MAFHADSKCIRFTKFKVPHKSYVPEKICLNFGKGGKHPPPPQKKASDLDKNQISI